MRSIIYICNYCGVEITEIKNVLLSESNNNIHYHKDCLKKHDESLKNNQLYPGV